MATPDIVRMRFRATPATQRNYDIPATRPESFWGPLVDRELSRHSPDFQPDRRSAAVLEAEFQTLFVRTLKNELAAYFQLLGRPGAVPRAEPVPTPTSAQARAADLIPLIGIGIASMRYGSLDLMIEFAGAKHLVELFDGNFDVFMMFAQAYLPGAFDNALHQMNFIGDAFLFDIAPMPELVSAFAAYGSTMPAPPPTGTAGGGRARTIWQVANFTLLIPVALSLLVLYVAAKSVSEEKADLQQWRKDLSAREQVFAKSVQDRLAQLEKMQGERTTPAEKQK